MGYSIRTSQYRYTIWMGSAYRSTQKFDNSMIVGEELYDYVNDPEEKENVFNEKKYSSISNDLKNKMLEFFKTQEVK